MKCKFPVQFLLNQQAELTAEITGLKEIQAEASRVVITLAETMTDGFTRVEAQAEADRQEIREAINNLIIANETTRDMTHSVASLQCRQVSVSTSSNPPDSDHLFL